MKKIIERQVYLRETLPQRIPPVISKLIIDYEDINPLLALALLEQYRSSLALFLYLKDLSPSLGLYFFNALMLIYEDKSAGKVEQISPYLSDRPYMVDFKFGAISYLDRPIASDEPPHWPLSHEQSVEIKQPLNAIELLKSTLYAGDRNLLTKLRDEKHDLEEALDNLELHSEKYLARNELIVHTSLLLCGIKIFKLNAGFLRALERQIIHSDICFTNQDLLKLNLDFRKIKNRWSGYLMLNSNPLSALDFNEYIEILLIHYMKYKGINAEMKERGLCLDYCLSGWNQTGKIAAFSKRVQTTMEFYKFQQKPHEEGVIDRCFKNIEAKIALTPEQARQIQQCNEKINATERAEINAALNKYDQGFKRYHCLVFGTRAKNDPAKKAIQELISKFTDQIEDWKEFNKLLAFVRDRHALQKNVTFNNFLEEINATIPRMEDISYSYTNGQ